MRWEEIRTIALVGASPTPERDSNKVMRYFQSKGLRVIPINPNSEEVNGERCYPSLDSIPEAVARSIDMVDVFRKSSEVLPIAEQTVRLRQKYGNVKVFWMQLGVFNEHAAELCTKSGIEVISNTCAMVAHSKIRP